MQKHLFVLLICISVSVCSQSISQLKETALTNAKTLATATLQKDKAVLLRYTHPNVRNAYGDQALLEAMEETFNVMATQHIEISTYTIHDVVTVVKEAKEYRCLITNTTQMDFKDQSIVLDSSLLGFYNADTSQWYFIEANKLFHDPTTQQLFPDFKTKIVIPKDEQRIE